LRFYHVREPPPNIRLGCAIEADFSLTFPISILARVVQGDADNRVRAIAKEVFNLTLVGWNRDSDDWCLNETGGS
jgi:hypothetical protein